MGRIYDTCKFDIPFTLQSCILVVNIWNGSGPTSIVVCKNSH